ncbi:hypothetical protein L1887_57913 [Cichorium endivia]|nr:hypothetical protein L1887_57913 [Cichorium endivia]
MDLSEAIPQQQPLTDQAVRAVAFGGGLLAGWLAGCVAGWLAGLAAAAAAAAAAPRVAKAKAANLERRRSIHRFIASHNCLLAFTRSRLGWLGPTHFILINLFVAAPFASHRAWLISSHAPRLPFLPSSRLSSVIEPSAVEQRRRHTRRAPHVGHTTAAFHDRPFAHNSSSDASSGSSSDTTLPMASYAFETLPLLPSFVTCTSPPPAPLLTVLAVLLPQLRSISCRGQRPLAPPAAMKLFHLPRARQRSRPVHHPTVAPMRTRKPTRTSKRDNQHLLPPAHRMDTRRRPLRRLLRRVGRHSSVLDRCRRRSGSTTPNASTSAAVHHRELVRPGRHHQLASAGLSLPRHYSHSPGLCVRPRARQNSRSHHRRGWPLRARPRDRQAALVLSRRTPAMNRTRSSALLSPHYTARTKRSFAELAQGGRTFASPLSESSPLLDNGGIYIVEPSSAGDIYVLSSANPGAGSAASLSGEPGSVQLDKLPLTLPQLVELSPFSFAGGRHACIRGSEADNPRRARTFKPASSALSLGGRQGRRLSYPDADACIDDEPTLSGSSSKSTSQLAYIGRTDYTLNIHSRSSPEALQTLHFSTFAPNAGDRDVQILWAQADHPDHRAILGMPEEGSVVCFNLTEADRASRHGASRDDGTRALWSSELRASLAGVFDVVYPAPHLQNTKSLSRPILVPHPSIPLHRIFPQIGDGRDQESEALETQSPLRRSAYLGIAGDSLYAMSSHRFPVSSLHLQGCCRPSRWSRLAVR